MKTLISLSLTAIFISSCSPSQVAMRRDDCKDLNWKQLGEIEGAKGLSLEMLDYHIKRCPPALESTARSKYISGHSNGINRYCTYRTGFILGEVGDPTPKLCLDSSFREFHKGYEDGLKAANK